MICALMPSETPPSCASLAFFRLSVARAVAAFCAADRRFFRVNAKVR